MVLGGRPTMIEKFLSAEPFPHLIVDEAVHWAVVNEAHREFDALPADAWHKYDGPDEAGKRACCKWEAIQEYAPVCYAILQFLSSAGAAAIVSSITGIEGLEPDPTLYGGGLHEMPPGSALGLHLDCERHPRTGNQRRVNAILYLNEIDRLQEHSDRFGGRLLLWDRLRKEPKAWIVPCPGRLLLMETGAHSYHSVEPIIEGVDAIERRSLAVYYWSPARARARFLSPAGEAIEQAVEAARIARSK